MLSPPTVSPARSGSTSTAAQTSRVSLRAAGQQTSELAAAPRPGRPGGTAEVGNVVTCSQYRSQVSALTGDDTGPPPAGESPRTPQAPPPPSASVRRWDRIRWALLACWLIAAGATILTGERSSSWATVQKLVATGQVKTVRVVAELPARGTGYSLVEVHWRHGPMRYQAEVMQVRGRGRPGPEAARQGATPVLHEAPSRRLSRLQPGLQVKRDQGRSNSGQLLGWLVPSWLALFAAALFFTGLALLIAGPQPWRATRWAWFWLQVPPVGGIVFLLASGPTPGVPDPRSRTRRLSGGWAFLLSLPLMGMLGPYRW